MNKEEQQTHSAQWEDRLQDAIDSALDDRQNAELRAHFDQCDLCRVRFAKLSALHARLANELSLVPPLGADFSAGVLARIDAHEDARRAAAKLRAEQEFRRRIGAFALDWRTLWQRHGGSLIASLSAMVAIGATLSTTFATVSEQFSAAIHTMPWLSNRLAVPVTLAMISASISLATLWWLNAKAR